MPPSLARDKDRTLNIGDRVEVRNGRTPYPAIIIGFEEDDDDLDDGYVKIKYEFCGQLHHVHFSDILTKLSPPNADSDDVYDDDDVTTRGSARVARSHNCRKRTRRSKRKPKPVLKLNIKSHESSRNNKYGAYDDNINEYETYYELGSPHTFNRGASSPSLSSSRREQRQTRSSTTPRRSKRKTNPPLKLNIGSHGLQRYKNEDDVDEYESYLSSDSSNDEYKENDPKYTWTRNTKKSKTCATTSTTSISSAITQQSTRSINPSVSKIGTTISMERTEIKPSWNNFCSQLKRYDELSPAVNYEQNKLSQFLENIGRNHDTNRNSNEASNHDMPKGSTHATGKSLSAPDEFGIGGHTYSEDEIEPLIEMIITSDHEPGLSWEKRVTIDVQNGDGYIINSNKSASEILQC